MFINKTRNILDLNGFNTAVKAHNAKIKIVLKFGEDDLRFELTEALTTQEDTDLDTFITDYVDVDPNDKIPVIYDYVKAEAKGKHFHNIDYKKELTSLLIGKRTITQGEVTKVEWYKTIDAQMNLSDKILEVDIVYTRDASGFALYRDTTSSWVNRDGSLNSETKVTRKWYSINTHEMIDEGVKRRGLLVKNIQMPVMTFMMEVLTPLGVTQGSVVLKGRAFMDDYETEFNKFVDNSSTVTDPADPDVGMKKIVVKLRDEANLAYTEWLDKAPNSLGGSTTIRQYLIAEFSI